MMFMIVSSLRMHNDDDLGQRAGGVQTLGEGGDVRVVAYRGLGGHVQHTPHVGPSAPDAAPAAVFAAVVGQGCHTH